MKKSTKFSPEVRERDVRLDQEHRDEYASFWSTIESIAPKIGRVLTTLHECVKRAEIDSGQRSGVSTYERERVKALEPEVKEPAEPTRS